MKPETKLLRFGIILLTVVVLFFFIITDMLEQRYPKMKCDFISLKTYKFCVVDEWQISDFDNKPEMNGSYYFLDDSLKLKGNYTELIELTTLYLTQRPLVYNKFMIFTMSFYNEGRNYEDRDREFEKMHLLGELRLKKLSAKSDSVKVVKFRYFNKDEVVIDTAVQIIVIETKIDTVK